MHPVLKLHIRGVVFGHLPNPEKESIISWLSLPPLWLFWSCFRFEQKQTLKRHKRKVNRPVFLQLSWDTNQYGGRSSQSVHGAIITSLAGKGEKSLLPWQCNHYLHTHRSPNALRKYHSLFTAPPTFCEWQVRHDVLLIISWGSCFDIVSPVFSIWVSQVTCMLLPWKECERNHEISLF